MGKLDGKAAIVTGAARGLGRAYAKRLAGLGAKVAVADLNLRSYEEFEAEAKDMTADTTVEEIEASGGIALRIEVDVRDHEAVEAMATRVVQEWGRVDVLVANAGGGRGSAHGYQGQRPRSGAVAACHGDEPVRDRPFVQRRRPDHEAAAFREDYHS
jgi:NAD(P)-dependent dehydrogenase (short-subunit alcohol dehydrogenase family)